MGVKFEDSAQKLTGGVLCFRGGYGSGTLTGFHDSHLE
jgi:hypothetical protein